MKILLSLIVLLGIGTGVYFSHHGLRDVRKLQGQIRQAEERVARLEKQNQTLKYQVSTLEKPTDEILEREVREFLGWVQPHEIVYLEQVKK